MPQGFLWIGLALVWALAFTAVVLVVLWTAHLLFQVDTLRNAAGGGRHGEERKKYRDGNRKRQKEREKGMGGVRD